MTLWTMNPFFWVTLGFSAAFVGFVRQMTEEYPKRDPKRSHLRLVKHDEVWAQEAYQRM